MKIMMDANQGFNVPDALELARRASSMGIQWFEEPVVHTDYAGYQLFEKTSAALRWPWGSGNMILRL